MFFESCKFIIKRHDDYLAFMNQFSDVLHGEHGGGVNTKEKYPLYVFIDGSMIVEHTYDKSEYERRRNKQITFASFKNMKYIVSYHFRSRFNERFEDVSDTRFKKLVGNMLGRGTWLKRKDSIKLIKYKKTSDYVLYSQYTDEKRYYLVVLTDGNILTTIYEFDIKDMKYFKES